MADHKPRFAVLMLDENDMPIDGDAFDTYDEAVEEAREGAALFLEHLGHGHFIPTIAVYSTEADERVWYWCPPTLSTLSQ
jgi:hypothetical protein